jgi:hypothetical protein
MRENKRVLVTAEKQQNPRGNNTAARRGGGGGGGYRAPDEQDDDKLVESSGRPRMVPSKDADDEALIMQAASRSGGENTRNECWDPRGSRTSRLKGNQDRREKILPPLHHLLDHPPATFDSLERDPSLTMLRAELSGVHGRSFHHDTSVIGDNDDWDPKGSKLEGLKNSQDQRSRRLPSRIVPATAAQQDAADTLFELERDPSLATLRAELSDVNQDSFKNESGYVDWDPRRSKTDKLQGFQDNRSEQLPSRLLPKDPAAAAAAENNLERDPSLTTLRAELSGVHAKSFKNTNDWDPHGSELTALKINQDLRDIDHLFPRPESRHLASKKSAVERDPSLTTLRAALSGVHAASFKNGSADNSKNHWDPHGSELAVIKSKQDQRRDAALDSSPPEIERDSSLTTLRAALSSVLLDSFKNGSDDDEWDPRNSKKKKLNDFSDGRPDRLPMVSKSHDGPAGGDDLTTENPMIPQGARSRDAPDANN